MNKPVKRFIAGAICPHCGQIDKVRLWRENNKEHTDCVHCKATDVFTTKDQGQPAVTPAQTVRIIH